MFLAEDGFASWLDGSAGTTLLPPAPENLLQMWPVSRRVNRSTKGLDDPALLDPVELSAA
jgi:putative SOS response-associated peptidase YedK